MTTPANSPRSEAPGLRVTPTAIPDVLILEPRLFGDERGFFFESYNQRTFRDAGVNATFVQDNHSRSMHGVLRGIHYQLRQPQGKLVRVVNGAVFDVAVDLRRSSPTFGRWVGVELSDENKRILWIPPRFGHGFIVLSQRADFLYKTTDFYDAPSDRTILWSDADLAINWPLQGEPIISAKDLAGVPFRLAEVFD
jgi:dTDP-4-dehydrorhamnose 3,5-epimerase